MNALEILKQQHREVEQMFEEYEGLKQDSEAKQKTFNAIADALAAHATIEEKIFYPQVYHEETQDLLREALEEHLSAKRIIADLMTMDPSDEQFDAKVMLLKEQIEHHVEEEEGELFPEVKSDFKPDELEAMGTELENLMAELMAEGDPRKVVPAETEAAPPL